MEIRQRLSYVETSMEALNNLSRSQKNAWRKVYRFVKMEQASNKSGR
jgi:uncharacterized protein YfkK (UPF0435 family)